MTSTNKCIAVIIGDIHFTVSTLELATRAVNQAFEAAVRFNVPLILNGDITDGKAMLRGEVANRLISILQDWDYDKVIVNVGNHDLISEKSKEHSLNFLRPYARVIDTPTYIKEIDSYIIPYTHNTEELKSILDGIEPGSRLIMHQGVQTAHMGHYAIDKASLPKECFKDFRVIASHYHRFQDIKCGRPRKGAVGLFSYVGSPYTVSFSEANDGPKGLAWLYEDGILRQSCTNLRKHVVIEKTVDTVDEPLEGYNQGDLLWLKVTGTYSELQKINKASFKKLVGHQNFKLDLIYADRQAVESKAENLTEEQLLDAVIDSTIDTDDNKKYLKQLWREIV